MEPPPPPPPPHGTNPQGGGRSGGLPNGKYDIFVIPPHSSGSGFLYLPSLQTHRNSFLAGVFCTAASFFLYYTAVPVVKEWLLSTINSGGTGVFSLICGVAVVAWAFGKTQSEWQSYPGFNRGGSNSRSGDPGGPGHSSYGNSGSYTQPGPQPSAQSPPPHPPNPGAAGGPPPPPNHGTSSPPPQSSWQKPPPQANTKANTTSAKSSWEKAREETRKREEERKRAEELKKRREELEKERQKQKDELEKERQRQEELEKQRQREKEELEKELQRQKEELERERQRQKDLLERERLKLREKELLERLERERKEKKEREEKEAAAKAAAAAEKAKQEQASRSPPKRPPMPTATTERDDDAYSFRPYDRPKRTHKANSAASMYSESSYAPSESTAKTTPPPSMRGPYSTKDPDKIVIKGVFSFNNAFMRTPISQLVSGQGNVTDGLILRITTEGLFIDDDVRGVPQREWDVKAWTMKLAEVWCPEFLSPENMDVCPPKRKFSLGFGLHVDARRDPPSPSPNESVAFVSKLLDTCGGVCKNRSQSRPQSCLPRFSLSNKPAAAKRPPIAIDTDSNLTQSCELSGLHVLRASIRDQEGKKYVFILSQSEGWKVAVGLQRLRRGTQVRALGVAGLPMNEAKAILENLGFV
ncbi:hypothetical protein AYL99_06496 [Fonsecaea erecta]|uniref:Uncharacterized protein n=1 Tax=Fonsecaea erecta TaxID=1367422 RepID=A0A178ZHD8_9EURO|nr:hypothetical protein AYL99_06496 [Fonsecaea erecta]OAP59198.1 hypothetical protein AYL99_06496 [Fonsecaea erecta]